MDISTGNWFNYLNENILQEGLRDIGLPEFVIDYLEDAMPDTSEKARMYIANNWKKSRGGMAGHMTIPLASVRSDHLSHGGHVQRLRYF